MKTEKFNQVFELLDATGLNWTVEKKPLFVIEENGESTATNSFGIMKGKNHLINLRFKLIY